MMSLIDDSIAAYLGRYGDGNAYWDESSNRNSAAIWTDSLSPFEKPGWVYDAVLDRPVMSFPGHTVGRTNNYQQRAPHAVAFEDVVPRSGEFAIVVWIYEESLAPTRQYFGSGRPGTTTGWALGFGGSGRPRVWFRGTLGETSQWGDGSVTTSIDTWNQIVVNASIAGNNVDLYVNGVEPSGYFDVADFTACGDFSSYWNRLHIGGTAPAENNFYNEGPVFKTIGPMIFSRLLTTSEIAELQTPPLTPEFDAASPRIISPYLIGDVG